MLEVYILHYLGKGNQPPEVLSAHPTIKAAMAARRLAISSDRTMHDFNIVAVPFTT